MQLVQEQADLSTAAFTKLQKARARLRKQRELKDKAHAPRHNLIVIHSPRLVTTIFSAHNVVM